MPPEIILFSVDFIVVTATSLTISQSVFPTYTFGNVYEMFLNISFVNGIAIRIHGTVFILTVSKYKNIFYAEFLLI